MVIVVCEAMADASPDAARRPTSHRTCHSHHRGSSRFDVIMYNLVVYVCMTCADDELFGLLSYQASPLLTSQQEARKQPSTALPPGFVVVWEFTSELEPFIHRPDRRRYRRSMRGCGLSPLHTYPLECRPSAIRIEMNCDALHVSLAELVTLHAPRLEAGNLARISRVALGLGHAAIVVALGVCARAQVE